MAAPQLAAMQAIVGTKWAPGDGPNATIGQWLTSIGASYPEMAAYCNSVLHMEYFQWCGLTVGYCMTQAGVRPVFGDKDTDRFLWALAWLEWGQPVQSPQPGDVVVFDFGGGDQHVTLFDSDVGGGYWACIGGNQGHAVQVSRFPRSTVKGIRRPTAGAATSSASAAPIAASPSPAVPTPSASTSATPAVAAQPGPAPSQKFQGTGTPLTAAGLAAATQSLNVGAAELWALSFTETEAPYGGFYADKRPQVLFERHLFHRLTGGRFDAQYPDLSNAQPGGYGAGGAHQYQRLAQAMTLDETAALQSASYGIGQVLGENYSQMGFATPQDMVARLFASEDEQLAIVTRMIVSSNAAEPLAAHDWKGFARIYNGPNYAANNYDAILRSWYKKISSGAAPDLRVRTAQLYLLYLGYEPSDIDGLWGKRTQAAMNAYQASNSLAVTDTLDDGTYAAIEADGKAVTGAGL